VRRAQLLKTKMILIAGNLIFLGGMSILQKTPKIGPRVLKGRKIIITKVNTRIRSF
jgi:hypothetical protein